MNTPSAQHTSWSGRTAASIGIVLIVVMAILLVLKNTACTRSEPKETIRIGEINPLTGPLAALGESVRSGILLATDEVNSKGGIGGRKLELLSEDDGSDPKSSVNAFTKLATVSKVPVVIGPLSSATSMATAPLAGKYKVVQLSTLAGTMDLTKAGDYVFRIYPSSEMGSRFIAKVAIERFKAKRVALFYANNALGVSSRKFISEVVQQAGVAIVATETFNDGDRDFRTQLTKIRDADPDVIMCSAYYEDGAQILVQSKELGLNKPILGEDNWFGPIAQTAGDALKNLYFVDVTFGPEVKDNKLMQEFANAFRLHYNKPANSHAAAGYAAVYVVKHAIEMGGYDGTKIKDALYKTDMLTAFGRIKYDENGDNVGATYALFQINKENERVLVQ
jgi:branched-chain amino acid transport system substrate-binding protein